MTRVGGAAAWALAGVGILAVAVALDGAGAVVVAAAGTALTAAGIVMLVRGRTAVVEALRRETETAAAMERRLAASEEDRRSLQGILEAMEEGVILVERGEVAFANPSASRLVGVSPGEGSLRVPGLRRLVGRAAGAGPPVAEEIAVGLPQRVVRASAMPVGPSDRVLLVVRDVTEARRVEAMRRDFVADASHELKTPVAGIQATAETLRGAIREDAETAGRFADRLVRDAVRLSRIVADLLDLSRLETGESDRVPVDLGSLVLEESDRVRDRAGEAGIELEVRVEPATVPGDRKDLGLLLANLLDNAVRYTGRGGRVRVALSASGGEAILVVSDTGIGIPSRDLPRIFERFYRVDRARSRETGGTGLGLSIARHVAERHGGRVEVESELGRGSTFRVTLPSLPDRAGG